jgi:hypothetical protein
MSATQLFFAPNTSERMQKLAEMIPPYDLLKAYREATVAFDTTDIVLVVSTAEGDGFVAKPRSAYVEEAFRKWTDHQRAAHPLAKESAHSKLKIPASTPAFWLVMEFHDQGAVGCCAIGSFLQAMLDS